MAVRTRVAGSCYTAAKVAAAAAITAGGLSVLSVAPAAGAAASPAAGHTETFRYAGPAEQTAVVPAGATSAQVRVVGGHGGTSSGGFVVGGDGAQVTGRIAVTPGTVLRLWVAGRGGDGNGVTHPGDGGWGWSDGGRGGSGSDYKGQDGGGGGGSSALGIAACQGCGASTLIVAGGGGGAGGTGFLSPFSDGGPGGSSGSSADPGHNGKGGGAGKGGAGAGSGQRAGGSGGGGASLGGAGGGGGAGLLGGAGGAGSISGGGGGGGGGAGSSLVVTPTVADPVLLRGRTDDNNGIIQVTWNNVAAPVCESQTVPVPHDSRGVPVRLHCTDTSRVTGYRILALPDHGTLDDRNLAAGTFSYVPERGYSGRDAMEFEGTFGDISSAPATVTLVISRGAPFMDLSASPATVPPGGAPVLTVHMPDNATGYVGFYDAAQPGADKGIGVAEIHDGTASLTVPSRPLVPGANPIHASYGGDANYDAADSNVVTVEVTGP